MVEFPHIQTKKKMLTVIFHFQKVSFFFSNFLFPNYTNKQIDCLT